MRSKKVSVTLMYENEMNALAYNAPMEERLLQQGMDCTPIIFEVDGATTGT